MRNPEKKCPQIPAGMNLVDTHCHLDMKAYKNLDKVIEASSRAGVNRVITVGIDAASSHAAVAIAGRFSGVYAAVGFHPHAAAAANDQAYDSLASLVEDNRGIVVGYGEIGLDYVRQYAPRDVQLKEFSRQLGLARDLNLPVILHDREAHADILRIMRDNMPCPAGGVMHCFSGDTTLARQVIDLGMYISIPGIVTFPGSDILRQVVQEIPLAHIILETDGPFLAPVPMRGKTNKPEFLLHTARKIAEIKEMPIEEVARQTTANAEALFTLKTKEIVH